jgi:hypothetical protein
MTLSYPEWLPKSSYSKIGWQPWVEEKLQSYAVRPVEYAQTEGISSWYQVAESGANVEKYSDRMLQLKSASQNGDEWWTRVLWREIILEDKIEKSEVKLIALFWKLFHFPFKIGKGRRRITMLRVEMERQLRYSWALGKSTPEPFRWTEHPRSTMDGPYHLWTFLKRNKFSDNEEAGL